MMKTSKRFLSILLAMSMLVSMSACGTPAAAPGPAAPATSADPAVPAAPAELSILVVGDNTPPDTNAVLKELEAKTNTKLKITYVSAKDSSAKLNTLIASKSLPDIFRVGSLSDVEELKNNGMLADLTPYMKDAPNIAASIGNELSGHPGNADGTYALFNGEKPYAQNLNIRTDWLANVNMPMPTDLDSLFEVLKAFTFNDPDGNGQNDTMGMGASIVAHWNNFTSIFGAYGVPCVSTGPRSYLMSDGTITTAMKNPGFLEAIKYFRKLYQAGVMDPDFATIPAMDAYGKLWNGKIGVFDFQCSGPTNNWMPARYVEDPVPTFDFAAIKTVDGKPAAQGKQYASYTPSVLVSSACKDPAAAVRLLDYLLSEEGGFLTYLGVEGIHYNWEDKAARKYKMIAPYDDSTVNRNDGVYVYSDFLRPAVTAASKVMNDQSIAGGKMASDMCTIEWPFIYTTFEAETIYGSTLHDIVKETFCQLVVSKGDVDKEFKDAIARWEAEGGSEWEKQATAAYNSQK